MGLFGKFFSKDVVIKSQNDGQLVGIHVQKKRTFHINSTLSVPQGFAFVFSLPKKVLDVITGEKFILTAATLPKTSRKLKLFKVQAKTGKIKTKFKAYSYLVSENVVQNLSAKSTEKADIFCGREKIGKIKSSFEFSAKVLNVQSFLSRLFWEFDILRSGEANKIVEEMVSDLLTKKLLKTNFSANAENELEEKRSEIESHIVMQMQKIGLEIVDFVWQKPLVKFFKNHQKPVENKTKHETDRQELTNNKAEKLIEEKTAEEEKPQTTDEKSITQKDVYCPTCGERNPFGSKFCNTCGSKIQPEKKAENQNFSNFEISAAKITATENLEFAEKTEIFENASNGEIAENAKSTEIVENAKSTEIVENEKQEEDKQGEQKNEI